MRALYNTLFVTILIGGSLSAWMLPGIDRTKPALAAHLAPAEVRRQTIAFHERRLTEDPHSALDMAQLAVLYMEEGRMSGNERAFVQAESLARRSLGERTRRNGRSAALLTGSLLAQHRFGEAVAVARHLVLSEPDQPAYRALLAEAEMEIGEYDAAIRHLGAVRERREELGIAPRLARWAELTGRTGDARRILQKALDEARRRRDLTEEQRAWFSLRLADFELRHGNLRAAAAAIAQGLEESPDDWRLTLVRARLEAAKGQWVRAIACAEQVLASVSSADALALLATAHRNLGRVDEAIAFEAALEQVGFGGTGSQHRTWMIAMLDNGSRDRRIVEIAAADTLVRRDAHSLDLLAWALYRSGQAGDALPVMRRATALGSNEPSLRYHAAMIEYDAGDETVAEQHRRIALSRARALSKAQVRELRSAGRN